MFHKTVAALILALLCVPAVAQAETSAPKKLEKLIEARDKSAKVWLDFMKGTEMKDAKDMDGFFAKIFGSKAAGADDADDDADDDDDDVASADEPCVSAADGKPGVSNSNGVGSNGGKGGTVIIDGKAATGDCYSANGGDGGSGNYSFGNNKVGGNGGKGGKIISR